MDIQNKQKLLPVLLPKFSYIVHRSADFRKNKICISTILPIQISPCNPCSSIAQNDSIWIEHRHYLKKDLLA